MPRPSRRNRCHAGAAVPSPVGCTHTWRAQALPTHARAARSRSTHRGVATGAHHRPTHSRAGRTTTPGADGSASTTHRVAAHRVATQGVSTQVVTAYGVSTHLRRAPTRADVATTLAHGRCEGVELGALCLGEHTAHVLARFELRQLRIRANTGHPIKGGARLLDVDVTFGGIHQIGLRAKHVRLIALGPRRGLQCLEFLDLVVGEVELSAHAEQRTGRAALRRSDPGSARTLTTHTRLTVIGG